jgi:hypothetical protein
MWGVILRQSQRDIERLYYDATFDLPACKRALRSLSARRLRPPRRRHKMSPTPALMGFFACSGLGSTSKMRSISRVFYRRYFVRFLYRIGASKHLSLGEIGKIGPKRPRRFASIIISRPIAWLSMLPRLYAATWILKNSMLCSCACLKLHQYFGHPSNEVSFRHTAIGQTLA